MDQPTQELHRCMSAEFGNKGGVRREFWNHELPGARVGTDRRLPASPAVIAYTESSVRHATGPAWSGKWSTCERGRVRSSGQRVDDARGAPRATRTLVLRLDLVLAPPRRTKALARWAHSPRAGARSQA
jgi:hypothetical protein